MRHRCTPVALTAAWVGVAAVCTPASAPAEPVPPISAEARDAGFVDVRSAVADAIVNLRYATSNNFTGEPLYPPNARCLVHESLVPGLATAATALRRQGQALVFWDCYRPHAAQLRMFEVVSDPNWVARPGRFARSHEAGRSVDVTFAEPAGRCPGIPRTGLWCPADLGTDFDDFSPRANAFATDGISPAAVANRATLRAAMTTGGLAPYAGEWWHFDGPGAGVDRPHYEVGLG